jgi:hypothetical protein
MSTLDFTEIELASAEAYSDDQPYPRINISVRDAGVLPIKLTVQTSKDSGFLTDTFASVEKAELAAYTIIENMRLADEANKRIKEKLHGA